MIRVATALLVLALAGSAAAHQRRTRTLDVAPQGRRLLDFRELLSRHLLQNLGEPEQLPVGHGDAEPHKEPAVLVTVDHREIRIWEKRVPGKDLGFHLEQALRDHVAGGGAPLVLVAAPTSVPFGRVLAALRVARSAATGAGPAVRLVAYTQAAGYVSVPVYPAPGRPIPADIDSFFLRVDVTPQGYRASVNPVIAMRHDADTTQLGRKAGQLHRFLYDYRGRDPDRKVLQVIARGDLAFGSVMAVVTMVQEMFPFIVLAHPDERVFRP